MQSANKIYMIFSKNLKYYWTEYTKEL